MLAMRTWMASEATSSHINEHIKQTLTNKVLPIIFRLHPLKPSPRHSNSSRAAPERTQSSLPSQQPYPLPKLMMNISVCPHPDPAAVAATEREIFNNYQFKAMTSILGVVVVFWLCTSIFFIYHFYKSTRANTIRRRFNEDQVESILYESRMEFVFWADNYRRRQQQAQQQRAQQQQVQQAQQNQQTQQTQQNQQQAETQGS
ncbi:hypothetical protein RRF57_002251 [Xylaria bambusicola]|uniref:Uncharacterized protein n=1 Tax=Xylaria bambusicola TaxID=326684 RepID=A0AAN7UIG8_9PEZI